MIYRTRKTQFGSGTLRSKIENAFGTVVFAATSLFFVSGAIGLFVKDGGFIA